MEIRKRIEEIRSGSLTAEENVFEKLEKINKLDGKIHAFIDVFPEEALNRAREIDRRIKEGRKVGKLAGLVIGVKNNICIKGKRVTCASKFLENYYAPYNATVVERILGEDGIILGTTNMDEFGCGSDTTSSYFFPTRNPCELERVPGGSSGGSAAAVKAGMLDLALGSDTGGSIRCPASFCGIGGLKPTYGLVSRYGLIDMGMSLEQIGVMSIDVYGMRLLLSVIAGKDDKDSVCAFSYKELDENLKGKRIGVVKEFMEVDINISEKVWDGIHSLENAGAYIEETTIPLIKYVIPVYYLQVFAEFSSAMQKYDGLRYGLPLDTSSSLIDGVSEVRARGFGKEVKRRILLGTYITMKEYRDAWYTKTLAVRGMLKMEFEKVLDKFDLLVGPTMPCLPWKIGERAEPLQLYLSDILTVSANLVGIPAGTIPCGYINRLPVGIQIHGKYFSEEKVLNGLQICAKY